MRTMGLVSETAFGLTNWEISYLMILCFTTRTVHLLAMGFSASERFYSLYFESAS